MCLRGLFSLAEPSGKIYLSLQYLGWSRQNIRSINVLADSKLVVLLNFMTYLETLYLNSVGATDVLCAAEGADRERGIAVQTNKTGAVILKS